VLRKEVKVLNMNMLFGVGDCSLVQVEDEDGDGFFCVVGLVFVLSAVV